MALTEHLTWRVTNLAMAEYIATTTTTLLRTFASGDRAAILIPPRGAKIVLKKMHGFIVSNQHPNIANTAVKIWLTKTDGFTTVVATESLSTPALWTYGMSHQISGTPADDNNTKQGAVIEVEFDPRHATMKPTRPTRVSASAFVGTSYGFGFIHEAAGVDFPYLLDLSVQYDLIWGDHKPSPNYDIAAASVEAY